MSCQQPTTNNQQPTTTVVTCTGRDLSGQSSWLNATLLVLSRGGGGSADCARSGATRSWRSRWPCPKPCTTLLLEVHGTCRTQPCGDRSRTGQGMRQAQSSTPCRRLMSCLLLGCGHPAWVSRQGPRSKWAGCCSLVHSSCPVLQMEDQLVDVLGYFSTLAPVVAEQVIEVPKVVSPPRAARTVLCAPQMADASSGFVEGSRTLGGALVR